MARVESSCTLPGETSSVRAREESAEAIVVKRPAERREERRAEEPREINQSPDFVRHGGKGSETKGRGNCGSYPGGSSRIGPWMGRKTEGWATKSSG